MNARLLAATVRLISGCSVCRSGCEPAADQCIYFANHSSHFDFLALWSALPTATREHTRPVAAADYWLAGRVRRYAAQRVFRAVLIDRAPGQGAVALDRILAALEGNDSLILFPEGSRGASDCIAPFKGGLYTIASRRPDVALVPVCLSNLDRVLPKGEFLPAPLRSQVTFGPPIVLEPHEERAAFLERARQAVVALQREARPA